MQLPERPVKTEVTPRVMTRIRNAERLIAVYGIWPDFHDAEITKVTLDRGNHMKIIEKADWANRLPPCLTAQVMTFDWRFSSDADRKYRMVTLRFNDIDDFSMEAFAYQNPIMGIGVRAETEEGEFRLAIEWGGTVMGHEAKFTCQSIDVVSVEPFDPPQRVKANNPLQPTAGSGG